MDMNASNDKRRIVDDDEKDIISNIPKDIIGHILSFLPINDAICTSVLSKRWELFWTSITDIRVEGVCLYFMRQEKKQCFINFMNRVLQNLSSKRIHSFTLRLTILFSEEENHCVPLPTWISSALNLGVQKLCIHYGSNKVYRFSILLFPNISLKHLDLNIGCNFIVPPSNCFKNLKILKLQHIKFIGDGSSHSEDMVLNFSVLELFDGRFCIWSNVKNIIIEAPLLESFSLVFPEYNFLKPCSPTIKICALHLKSFHYSGLLPGDIILSNPLSVVYACIEVRPTNHPSVQINNFSGDELRQYGAKACKLLKELRRVNFLKLGLYMLKFLACDKDYVSTLPVFQSLVHLELDLSYRLPSQQILLDLLHKSPNIESLELLSDLTKLDKDLLMPQSFLSNLKVVKIRCFDWNGNNLSLTKYILDNTKVLEQLTILVWKGMKRQMRKELRSPNDSNVALVQIEKTTLTSLNYYRSSFYEPE